MALSNMSNVIWIDHLEYGYPQANPPIPVTHYAFADILARENLNTLNSSFLNLQGDLGQGVYDTKNTTGSLNNQNTKLYLVGAESQSVYTNTTTNSNVYIGTDNKIHIGNSEVLTTDNINNSTLNNTSTTTVPSQASVANYISNQSFLVYKGQINDQSDLPSTQVKIGDTYRVATEGSYENEDCEIGDLIVAIADTPIWTFVHNSANIDTSNFVIGATDGLTLNEGYVGHSNSEITPTGESPLLYPITIDEFGHITNYGDPIAVDIETGEIIVPQGYDDATTPISNERDPGTSTQWARGDHTHTISGTTIANALQSDSIYYSKSIRIGSQSYFPDARGVIDLPISSGGSGGIATIFAGDKIDIESDSESGYPIISHEPAIANVEKTVSALYPIKIDRFGHITEVGNPVDPGSGGGGGSVGIINITEADTDPTNANDGVGRLIITPGDESQSQVYQHAITNKGIALTNNVYSFTTNSQGHVTAGTPVTIPTVTSTYNASDTANAVNGVALTSALNSKKYSLSINNRTVSLTYANGTPANSSITLPVETAYCANFGSRNLTTTSITRSSSTGTNKYKMGNGSFTLAAGTWLIIAHLRSAVSSGGTRALYIFKGTITNGTSPDLVNLLIPYRSYVIRSEVNGFKDELHLPVLVSLSTSTTITIAAALYGNASSSLNFDGYVTYIRLNPNSYSMASPTDM